MNLSLCLQIQTTNANTNKNTTIFLFAFSLQLRSVDTRCTITATREERDAHGLATRCPRTVLLQSSPSLPPATPATGTTATTLAPGARGVLTNAGQAIARAAFVLQRRPPSTKCAMDRNLVAITSQLATWTPPAPMCPARRGSFASATKDLAAMAFNALTKQLELWLWLLRQMLILRLLSAEIL